MRSPFPPTWGLVNGKLVNRSLPDGQPVNMPESMKLPPELRAKNAVRHYTPVQRMGYPPGVKCWCGSMLEFNYHEPGMSKRRKAFFDEHDDCSPTDKEQI
jgi:hypothetical protein